MLIQLEPFMENLIEEDASTITTNKSDPPASCLQKSGSKRETIFGSNRCGKGTIQVKRKATPERKEPAVPSRRGEQNQFVHSLENLKREECKRTENTRAGCGKPSTP